MEWVLLLENMRADCAESEEFNAVKVVAHAIMGKVVVITDRKVVAIVEDDSSVMKVLQRLLTAHGLITETYTSAEKFLERGAESQANCLILDINLGGISGLDLRRRLAAAGSRLPVIFMTAGDSEKVQREAVALGCIAYLHKPFPAGHLIDAIAQAAS